ncbi:hypothetical protein JY96_06375 [Aquabacterium sp. NJ1]|uniref:hypothetical protein n=1 Tax=Aquabacterium sp. NJ1 TaxID=1538295 RepID=UPI00052B64FD|nr:hypothetical protein [Aquabacterium sp. NJ1]KGM39780.1 hypothetical protein JY96_06375 [Aquabacterium sp. NJ1]
MISDDLGPKHANRLFRTPVGTASARRLRAVDLKAFTPNTESEVDHFLVAFCEGWRQRGHEGALPERRGARKAMDEQDRNFLWLWDLARKEIGRKRRDPSVAIAPLLSLGNPVIIPGPRPLIVMAEGLWSLIMKVALGILVWADGPSGYEDAGLTFVRHACEEWRTNDPERGPPGRAVISLSTLDQDITTFAVGLAHGFFTWAYLHELGHFRLGHLPSAVVARAALAGDDSQGQDPKGEVRAYMHAEELQADAFAADAYLRLMPLELTVRGRMEFGQQIDHAPLIGMEVINLAMRLAGRSGDLTSSTHPAPLTRRSAMADSFEPRFTLAGRSFYAAWTARLIEAGEALGVPRHLV